MRFLNGCTFNVFSLSCLDRISIYLLTFVFLLIQLYILCLMGENLNYLDLNIFLEERERERERERVCVSNRERPRKRARRREERWVVLVMMIRARAGCDLLVFDMEVDIKAVE